MPAIRNINPLIKDFSEADRRDHEVLFRDLSDRIATTLDEFRAAHGFKTGEANTFVGQTVIVNGLLHEAALQAAVTSILGNEPFNAAQDGFVAVFRSAMDKGLDLIADTILSLEEANHPEAGMALIASLLTAVLAKVHSTTGGLN